MEEMNKVISDLAVIVAKENFFLDKCEDLLASTAVMEVTNQTHKSKKLWFNTLNPSFSLCESR